MLIRRRSWLYRLTGQLYAKPVTFDRPVTAAAVRAALRRSVGMPEELWTEERIRCAPEIRK